MTGNPKYNPVVQKQLLNQSTTPAQTVTPATQPVSQETLNKLPGFDTTMPQGGTSAQLKTPSSIVQPTQNKPVVPNNVVDILNKVGSVVSAVLNPGEAIVKSVENNPSVTKALGMTEEGAFPFNPDLNKPVSLKDIRTLTPAGKAFLGNTINSVMGGLMMNMPATSSLAETLPGLSKTKAAIGSIIGGGLPIIQNALNNQKINWWDVALGTVIGGYFGLLLPKGMPEGTPETSQRTLDAIDVLQKNGIGDMTDYRSWIVKNHPDRFTGESKVIQEKFVTQVNGAVETVGKDTLGESAVPNPPTKASGLVKWADDLWNKIVKQKAVVEEETKALPAGPKVEPTIPEVKAPIVPETPKVAEQPLSVQPPSSVPQGGSGLVTPEELANRQAMTRKGIDWQTGKTLGQTPATNIVSVPEVTPQGKSVGTSQTVEFPTDQKLTDWRTTKQEMAQKGSGYTSNKADIIIKDASGNEVNRINYDEAVKKWGTTDRNTLAQNLVNGSTPPTGAGEVKPLSVPEVQSPQITANPENIGGGVVPEAQKGTQPIVGESGGVGLSNLTYPEKLTQLGQDELNKLTQPVAVQAVNTQTTKLPPKPSALKNAGVLIKRTDVQTLLKNSTELQTNPVLKVVNIGNKSTPTYMLNFTSPTTTLNIAPGALGLSQEGLKDGELIGIYDTMTGKGEIPVVSKLGETSNPTTLYKEAIRVHEIAVKDTQPMLDKGVADLSKYGKYHGNTKSVGSIVKKVIRKSDLDYTPSSEPDLARGAIVRVKPEDLATVVKQLQSKGFTIQNTIDEPLNAFGYRGLNANIKINGQGAEIQVHPVGSWKLKTKISDAIYRKWRDIPIKEMTPQQKIAYNKDITRSVKIWTDYWDKVPLEVKSAISDLVKGEASINTPINPLKGIQPLPVQTTGSLPRAIGRVSTTLPSSNLSKAPIVKASLTQPSTKVKVPEKFAPESTTLYSGVNPGIDKFIEQDVLPSVSNFKTGTIKTIDLIKKVLNPASRGELAQKTASIMRENLGKMVRNTDITYAKLEDARKIFDKYSKQQSLDFIYKLEAGEPIEGAEKFVTVMRDALDTRWKKIQEIKGGDTYIENYFPHIWKDPEKAASTIARSYTKRPFEGTKGYMKQRTIPTIQEGVDLGLIPESYNPVDSVMGRIADMDRFLMAHDTWNQFKDEGLRVFVRKGQKAPEGWIQPNDKIAKTFAGANIQYVEGGKSYRGTVQQGAWYMPEQAATILNNYLSPGLRGNPLYDGFRKLGNSMTQVQLGLSAFHATFTSIDAVISRASLGLQQVVEGKPIKGLKTLSSSPVAWITNVFGGNKLLKDYYREVPQVPEMISALERAGGRVSMDKFYHNNSIENFLKALRSGNYLGATLRTPGALIELLAKPILGELVPRQKLGIFSDLAKDILDTAKAKNWDDRLTTLRLQEAWDSVDNRMGQMVYDNLFWNKALKDLSMASVRSVGWNLGTIRELGGGITQTASIPIKLFTAKGRASIRFTPKMAYTMVYPFVVGLLGAIIGYLYTKKKPETLKDYFYPKTGRKNPNGTDERVSLPSYMKDVFAYGIEPVQTAANKINPFLGTIIDMLKNEDYYGTQIRNPNDPLIAQLQEEASFVAKQYMPFSVSGFLQSQAAGDSTQNQALSFLGIQPAPKYIVETTMQREISNLYSLRNAGVKSPDSFALSQAKSNIRRLYLLGQTDQANAEMVKLGLTKQATTDLIKSADVPVDVRLFQMLSSEDQQALIAKMNMVDLTRYAWSADTKTRAIFSTLSSNAKNFADLINKGDIKPPIWKKNQNINQ
jgi:hypothetical protein